MTWSEEGDDCTAPVPLPEPKGGLATESAQDTPFSKNCQFTENKQLRLKILISLLFRSVATSATGQPITKNSKRKFCAREAFEAPFSHYLTGEQSFPARPCMRGV